jgi:hypothetical protein
MKNQKAALIQRHRRQPGMASNNDVWDRGMIMRSVAELCYSGVSHW